jgi:tetratricopeptide (TPR) repeat protein
MAGNRVVYQDAIRKAHNSAWDRKWLRAIEEYQRALKEFPGDFDARQSLSHALEEAGQLESALHECETVVKHRPKEGAALIRVAILQEKLNRMEDAVATYISLAQVYLEQGARGKAVEAWQKAASIAPERIDIHEELAQMYHKGNHNSLAAKEYLTLAKIYQKQKNKELAAKAADKARELDPDNPAIRSLTAPESKLKVAENILTSPVDQAKQVALSQLANTLLEDQSTLTKSAGRPGALNHVSLSKPEVDALIAHAVDAQTHRRIADAITCYRKLIAGGINRPEVIFNLGLLYSETMEYDEAIRLLRETTTDPQYSLASHFELGKCYRIQGDMDQAVEHFLAVTEIVDLGSVQRDQVDELISVYQELANSYSVRGDTEKADKFQRVLSDFLSSKGWEDKVVEVQQSFKANQENDRVNLEASDSPEASKVMESLALAREYLRRGKTIAAGDECLRAIELAPEYLPAHMRLAEVLVREGKIEEAKDKYRWLAELCYSRGDPQRAESFYREVLRVAPDDVISRSKLIDISLQTGRVSDVLEHYLQLGNDYFGKGDFTRAAEKFGEGIRYSPRDQKTNPMALTLKHRYAESLDKSKDFRHALSVYQEIKKDRPEDERARLNVIELLLRLGQFDAAMSELDELTRTYQKRSEFSKLISVLEGLVSTYPDQQSLMRRLADSYVKDGNLPKAIDVLDSLGELQLTAGEKESAATTIRQIIALNPPNVDDYKQLLEQIVKAPTKF